MGASNLNPRALLVTRREIFMRPLRAWCLRFAALFHKEQRDRELAEELESHLQMHIEDNLRSGMKPEEARRQALIKLGGVEQTKERYRDRRGIPLVETVLQDLRFALRMLRKNAGFTAVAVLTLALGIAANTAIFSVVDEVLIRPLPFDNSSRLIIVHESMPKMGYPKMGFSPPDLAVFAREQKSFSAIGAFQNEHVDISGHGAPERVMAARVSAPLFPMLGVEPLLGRTIAPEEDAPGYNVVLLSYGLWQRRFGGATAILGQAIDLDRQPYTIIGVMRRNFEFPLTGPVDNGSPAELWMPMAFTPAELQDWGGTYVNSVVGRLRPGVTLDQARGEAKSLAHIIVVSYPPALTIAFHDVLGLHVDESPFQEEVVGSVRTLLLILTAAVAFILLIACANIATLLVSRAATRQKEIAIRITLGATRLRLVRQMFTESVLLALGGGGVGIILAFWGRNLILAAVPSSIALPHHVSFHGVVFAFALGVSILAAVIFGLAPAFQISAASMQVPLQESGRNATPGRSHHRLQGFFVTIEFALTLILLSAAGLLIRSFDKLLATSPGFHPDNVLTLNVPLSRQPYPRAAQIQNFYEELLDRVSNSPGVQTAGLSSDLPLNAREMVSMTIEGRGPAAGTTPQVICQSWVLGSYFQTMGIPLVQGRWFTSEDSLESDPVTIVSLSTARKFWPGQSAIGKRIRWGVNDSWHTIVGIVGDVSQGPLNTPLAPHVYQPFSQLPGPFLEEDPFGDWHAMNLAVRTKAVPASVTSTVLADIHSLDPDLAAANIQTMTQVISSSSIGPEFNTVLLGVLAGFALLLSAIGVYGVLAYVVVRQTHEIGIRMALGGKPADVFGLILGRGARLAGMGAGFGLVAALGLTHLMKGLLYGVSAVDPLAFIGAVIVLVAIALLASYIPACRAMRVDPAVALRHE
jgi:predicted permease